MLSVKNVEKSFPIISGNGPLLALHKLSFTMKAGEFTCLIGPSGSGKTTLINLIAGVLQPTRGTIYQGRSIQGRTGRGVSGSRPCFPGSPPPKCCFTLPTRLGDEGKEKPPFLSLASRSMPAYPHQLGDEAAGCPGTVLLEPRLPPGRTSPLTVKRGRYCRR